jgi:hypothetical protein
MEEDQPTGGEEVESRLAAAEMVRGGTIDEIDASVEGARRAYDDISRRVTEQIERQLPAGNPARSGSTAGAEWLKPEAKIALGLRGK